MTNAAMNHSPVLAAKRMITDYKLHGKFTLTFDTDTEAGAFAHSMWANTEAMRILDTLALHLIHVGPHVIVATMDDVRADGGFLASDEEAAMLRDTMAADADPEVRKAFVESLRLKANGFKPN